MSKHQIKKMLLPEIYKLGPPPKKEKYKMKNEDLRGLDPSKSKEAEGSPDRSHETPVHGLELGDEQEVTMNLVQKQNDPNRSAVASAATPRTALLKSPDMGKSAEAVAENMHELGPNVIIAEHVLDDGPKSKHYKVLQQTPTIRHQEDHNALFEQNPIYNIPSKLEINIRRYNQDEKIISKNYKFRDKSMLERQRVEDQKFGAKPRRNESSLLSQQEVVEEVVDQRAFQV